jgi:hypothetical protein
MKTNMGTLDKTIRIIIAIIIGYLYYNGTISGIRNYFDGFCSDIFTYKHYKFLSALHHFRN